MEAADKIELEQADSDEAGLAGTDVKEVGDKAELAVMDSDEVVVLVEGLDETKVLIEGMAIDTAVLKDVNLVNSSLTMMEGYVILWLEVLPADDARLLFALTIKLCVDIVDCDGLGWGDGNGWGEGVT